MNMSRQKRTLLLLIMALLCSTTGRHMVATPQGDIYIACSGVGKVGVVRVEK